MGGRPLHRWGIARLAQLRNLPVSKTGAVGPLRRARRDASAKAHAEGAPRRPRVHRGAGLGLAMERLAAFSGGSQMARFALVTVARRLSCLNLRYFSELIF